MDRPADGISRAKRNWPLPRSDLVTMLTGATAEGSLFRIAPFDYAEVD
jgi:hypothetical protein